jgi:hypothetical protein
VRRPGIHQFQAPINRMEAGTTTSRTTVASMAIATAMPSPSCSTGRMPAKEKAPNTTTMGRAAPEISGAVRARPRATLPTSSPVRRWSSRTRLNRKTS